MDYDDYISSEKISELREKMYKVGKQKLVNP